jgi:endonuclease YncB( thermonuclease family)
VGTVTAIIDGDTIDVNIGGQQYRVRYIGIDTPEKDEYYYYQATSVNQALVLFVVRLSPNARG